MAHGLHDLARHNSWATEQILGSCRELSDAELDATVPGTFGTIIEMLRHTINTEAGYLFRVSGIWTEYPWPRGDAAGLELVAERAAIVAAGWETFLASDYDNERRGEARGDDGSVFSVPAGIFVAQAFHHGSEHRAQICTVLGAIGKEAPDVSAWGYAKAAGRSTLVSGPTSTE